jgi:hypothetical protein
MAAVKAGHSGYHDIPIYIVFCVLCFSMLEWEEY